MAPGSPPRDGRRTFAVFEVMVREPWRGTGEAARIHERMLRDRPEQRATLLVDASHNGRPTTLRAVGLPSDRRPAAVRGGPVYTMMVRQLHAT